MSSKNLLKQLEKQRTKLISELLEAGSMLRGSFSTAQRKCGTKTCWCAKQDGGHPYDRITWTEESKNYTRTIPKVDLGWIKELTSEYKRFRTARADLRRINTEIEQMLNDIEKNKIKQSRDKKKYLKI